MAEALVRRMIPEDVERVAAIEAEAFPRPWTADDFRHELTENKVARYLVIEEAGEVVGFAGVHVIIDQGHVTNIAVSGAHQGKGYGRLVTAALMQYAANLGATYLTLEVRASNHAAQALYTSLGFIKVSVRKRYYEDNGEDAWLMACDQMPAADPDFEEPETVWE